MISDQLSSYSYMGNWLSAALSDSRFGWIAYDLYTVSFTLYSTNNGVQIQLPLACLICLFVYNMLT
jgi:hypothetical protein